MRTLYAVLLLTHSLSLFSCGGTSEEKTEPPAPGDIETETIGPSRATVGPSPGKFVLDDADITVLSREPRAGAQVVTFVYTGPYFSEVRAEDILEQLSPRLSGPKNKPASYGSWDDVMTVGFHETKGEVFEVFYPDIAGECVLNVNTVNGPVTVELGEAGETYRYTEKVRPGVKVNMRDGPSVETTVIGVLEPGFPVFPTGELELGKVVTEDDVEMLLFQKITVLRGDTGWVIKDDEVFEYGGYTEASSIY